MTVAAATSAEHLARSLFAAIDRQDLEEFGSYLTDDASFRFGNMPAAEGRENIMQAAGAFFGAITSLRHEFLEFFEVRDACIVEQLVHYVDGWGRGHVLPCANVLRLRDGKVADYRIFMDTSPLFTAPEAGAQ